jgi:type IV secretion system protein VirB8
VSKDRELALYFEEAASWDADRAAQSRRSARIAWVVAGAGWACTGMVAAALMLLMPLKRVDPFVVRVNDTSGVVDVVPVYEGKADLPEAVTRYFLTHYVTICERFTLATAESDYQECGAFHTGQRNQAWYALWTQTNPQSPLNLNKDGSTVRAQVSSVSFFQRGNGITDLAQVRYLKIRRSGGAGAEEVSHWIATIQYAYAEPASDPNIRRWNPLGLKIIEFKPEREAVRDRTEAAQSGASSAAGMP